LKITARRSMNRSEDIHSYLVALSALHVRWCRCGPQPESRELEIEFYNSTPNAFLGSMFPTRRRGESEEAPSCKLPLVVVEKITQLEMYVSRFFTTRPAHSYFFMLKKVDNQ